MQRTYPGSVHPSRVVSLIALSLMVAGGLRQAPTASNAAPPVPQTLRILAGDVSYQGAFRVPPQADLRYDQSGNGLTFDQQRGTLFVSNYADLVSEMTVPAADPSLSVGALPQASQLQGPTDVLRGRLSQAGDRIGGLLTVGGDLVVSTHVAYDASGTGRVSHFLASTNLSLASVTGPVKVGTTNPGYVGGPMAHVPFAWQSLVGGPALTGLCCISIISRSSYGPAASVFDPASLLTGANQIAATQVLAYPQAHPTLGGWNSSGNLFNSAVEMGGMVWVDGTATVLYFGRYGARHCYGTGAACNDPTSTNKGNHAYPYDYFVWAYDANDLVAVSQGRMAPWAVVPYSTWTFDMPFATGARVIRGVAYDPATQRIFLAEQKADGQSVVIRVLHVNATPGPRPPDADGDGIPDSRDNCPGTPPGTTINSAGCTVIPGGTAAPASPASPASPTSPASPNSPASPPPTSGGCITADPFVALGGGTCAGGNWFPPGMPIPSQSGTGTPTAPSPTPPDSDSSSAPSPPASPVGCATGDPFVVLGGGTCFNGNWFPPGMPIPGLTAGPVSPAPAPAPAGPTPQPVPGNCGGLDPFAAIPGLIGHCVNGNWLPMPGLTGVGRMERVATNAGNTTWVIRMNGVAYEIVGGFSESLRHVGLVVSFEAAFRLDITPSVPGNVVIELITISAAAG